MRRSIAFVFVVAVLATVAPDVRCDTDGQQLAENAGRSLVGTPAPRLVLHTIDGATIDLGKLYGRQAVYLKFWATWCVPCREQMPHFEHVYETAGPDLAVIAINAGFNDTVHEIRTYRSKLHITMPIVLDDGAAGAAFHLRVTPQHIVIGRDGRILYVGHLADARLDAALKAARTTAVSSTPAASSAMQTAPAVVRISVGDRVPEGSRQTLDGQTFALRDAAAGRPTVLVFLSPWCESYLATTRPAVSAACRRMRLQVNTLAREPGVRWLGIASGLWATEQDLQDYQREFQIEIPLTLDESGHDFRAFDVTQVPTVLAIDADGRVLCKVVGDDFRTPIALRQALGNL